MNRTANLPQAVLHNMVGLTAGPEQTLYGRSGMQPIRSRNAALLLLWLYFHDPADSGSLHAVDIDTAASDLDCHARTIRYSLGVLSRSGYLAFRPLNIPGRVDVILSGYVDMYRTAREGGVGYLTLDSYVFGQICQFHDILSLRATLRLFLATEAASRQDGDGAITEMTYRDIRIAVSSHCTRHRVRELMAQPAFRAIMDARANRYTAELHLHRQYAPAAVKSRLRADAEDAIRNKISGWSIGHGRRKKPFKLLPGEMDDLSAIALRYPVRCLLSALDAIYRSYIQQGLEMGSLGALTRTFARQYARGHGWIETDGAA